MYKKIAQIKLLHLYIKLLNTLWIRFINKIFTHNTYWQVLHKLLFCGQFL